MSLLSFALIDTDYYKTMMGLSSLDQATTDKVINLINKATVAFEDFCNRPLKARTFDYAPLDGQGQDNADYSERYAIFDGITGVEFYFPTYPVNSVTSFYINDVEIIAATDYSDLTGYHLKNAVGKLVYYGSFYYGYVKNIKAKWNGGYTANHAELEELKYLCFDMVRTLVNVPNNPNLQSEKIGNYSYTNYSPLMLKEMQGLNAQIFSDLRRYRKEVI